MNRKTVYGLGLLLMPIGALLLTACGKVADIDNADLGLEEASHNYYGFVGPWTEYGLCNDGWDNDGNGLRDVEDPACHVLGPVRDLSLFPAPLGHNFAPDVSVIPLGSPGSLPSAFRDRDQITRWMRFLTDTNGYTAGIDLYGAAMDSPMVPVPVPLFPKVLQGTAAQGNNNNIDGIAIPLNAYIPPVVPAVGAVVTEGAVVEGVAVTTTDTTATTAEPAAPAPGNTLNTSYKPELFQGQAHGRYGHSRHDMKVDDRQARYAPLNGMDTLGRQSGMLGANNQSGLYNRGHNPQVGNMLQNRGYAGNNADPRMANTESTNNLSPNVQGTSLLGSDYGSPGDWPKGTTGPGYQNTGYGRQAPSFGQNGSLPQTGFGAQGNSWGQQRGYPQANNFGQQRGAYPQTNSWNGQPGAFQQGGYPQGNNLGFGQRPGLQGNSWGQQPGSYPQGNSWGQQPGSYPQGNSWGQQRGAFPQGNNSWGQQPGSWPGAR